MAAADYVVRNSKSSAPVNFLILESTNRTGGRSQEAILGTPPTGTDSSSRRRRAGIQLDFRHRHEYRVSELAQGE